LIETYQIRNVLRVYSSQLKKKTTPIRDSIEPFQPSYDFIDISIRARRKQMLNQMSDNLISQIMPRKDQHTTEENTEEDRPQIPDSGDRSNYETE
jgi:hypothetical protein